MGISIRPYQEEAVDRVLKLYEECEIGAGVESPTGTGKSLMMAHAADRIASKGGRVLILAHREELVTGNAGAVERLTGERCFSELNTRYRMTGWDWAELKSNGGIVSASVDTLQGDRLKSMPADLFTHILVDEAHHVRPLTNKAFGYDCKNCHGNGKVDRLEEGKWVNIECPKCDGKGELKETGSKYYKVRSHFNLKKWMGFSGTFYRGGQKGKDGRRDNIITKVFDKVYQTGTIWDFVDQGWLVEPVFDHMAAVKVLLDFSKLKTKHVSEKQAQEVWNTHKLEALSALRNGLYEKCGNRITLIFSPKVQHAVWITEFLQNADTNAYPTMGPETADYVASYTIEDDGSRGKYHDDRRRGVVERMRAGQLQWCANQGVFTEGTDIPTVGALAMCRTTESVNLMKQMIGRGLRTEDGILNDLTNATAAERIARIAASRKPNCLVLDMAGITQDDSAAELVNPTMLIEQPGWTDAQRKLAERYFEVMWERGKAPGLREAKEEIEHASTEWMQGVRTMMQEAAETVDWTITRVDIRNGTSDRVASHYNAENPDRPTDKQINYCLRLCRDTKMYGDLGKEDIEALDWKTVSTMIAKMKPVQARMPPPYWMKKELAEHGFSAPATYAEGQAIRDTYRRQYA